ncbi:MAG TPA: pilus assembly protein N-terminal domain-containing protein, partial [Thermoanaerobaculia bacterium]
MRLAAAASLATLLFARPAPAQDGAATIHLGVGEQKIVPVPGVTRVAIGEPDVADVKQVGSAGELLLSGLAEGRTSLLAWRNNGTRVGYAVIVRRQDPRELVSEVRALLGEREGVEVRVVGDRVYLDGQTFTAEDWDRVHQVTQLFPMVTSFVRQSPEAKRLASEALNRAYRKTGLASVQAGVVGDTLVLEGSVESEEERKKLDALTRALGEKAESLVTVGVKTLVLVEVEFVEVSSGANKLVGVKPPSTLVSTGSGATAAVSVVQPIPGLDAGQTQRSGSLGVSAS